MPDPYTGEDFYCDVAIPKKVPLDILHESERVLAFRHTRPYWPTHIVVVPKTHIPSLWAIGPDDAEIIRELLLVVKNIACKVEYEHGAARILTNLGRYQDSKHLHFHVSSGEPLP